MGLLSETLPPLTQIIPVTALPPLCTLSANPAAGWQPGGRSSQPQAEAVPTVATEMMRLCMGAILCGRHDGGRVESPADAGLCLVPGIGIGLPPLHQLGQEGQHLLRVSKGVLRLCGLDLQGQT